MQIMLIAVFGLVTIAGFVYLGFEVRLLLGYLLMRGRMPAGATNPPERGSFQAGVPTVLVQVPLFNEGAVALEVVAAGCALEYPADRLQIQVLDDSTDDTPSILAPLIANMRAKGIDVRHLRREQRHGWKAGALAWGLTMSDAEFVTIFDADFLPQSDFLRRGVVESRAFEDSDVAFLQGRWTYANERQNLLTRAQAILIDRHFAVQKPYQSANGRTLTFNGSAGIFRRSAIDAAGGWSGDTLCEDLDLSYRCALVGLKGAYDIDLPCSSEIPPSVLAFKLQQRRWAKGTAQCLRKLGGEIFRSRKIRHKPEDMYAMAGYVVHPIMLAYSLLWPWIALRDFPDSIFFASQFCMTIASVTGNVTLISGLLLAAVVSGRRINAGLLKSLGFALIVGMALMVNTAIAFLVGCFQNAAVFERTPKQGGAAGARRSGRQGLRLHWSIFFEAAFLIYMTWMTWLLVDAGHAGLAVSCLLFVGSVGFLIAAQIADRFQPSIRSTIARLMPFLARVRGSTVSTMPRN